MLSRTRVVEQCRAAVGWTLSAVVLSVGVLAIPTTFHYLGVGLTAVRTAFESSGSQFSAICSTVVTGSEYLTAQELLGSVPVSAIRAIGRVGAEVSSLSPYPRYTTDARLVVCSRSVNRETFEKNLTSDGFRVASQAELLLFASRHGIPNGVTVVSLEHDPASWFRFTHGFRWPRTTFMRNGSEMTLTVEGWDVGVKDGGSDEPGKRLHPASNSLTGIRGGVVSFRFRASSLGREWQYAITFFFNPRAREPDLMQFDERVSSWYSAKAFCIHNRR